MTKPRIRVKASSIRMGELHRLNVVTKLDLNPSVVLDAARDHDLTDVVVLGYTPEGEEYFASSVAGGPEVLWLLERCKRALLNVSPNDIPPAASDPEGTVLPFVKPQ